MDVKPAVWRGSPELSNPVLQHLGEQIRLLRKEAGLSQEELAFEAKLDRSFMGAVERGETNPSVITLCAIATAIGCDVPALTIGLPLAERARGAANRSRRTS